MVLCNSGLTEIKILNLMTMNMQLLYADLSMCQMCQNFVYYQNFETGQVKLVYHGTSDVTCS